MLDRLVSRIASLNPDAGEIGAGMLAQIVAEARAVDLSPLIALLDRDASYHGGEVRIDLGGTHAEAVATVRQARRVLGL